MANLVIIRGLPGSGKSWIGKYLADNHGFAHFETDTYFVDKLSNKFVFDGTKLDEAHKWCRRKVTEALKRGRDVVVTNVFTTNLEIYRYRKIAIARGSTFEVVEATGKYQNMHGVPEKTIEKMRNRWEIYDPYWVP